LTPGPLAVGEHPVIHLPEQPFHQRGEHRGLARKVGIDRIGRYPTLAAMPRTEAAFTPPASSGLSAASRISSSVNARRGPGRRRPTGAVISSPFRDRSHLDLNLYAVHNLDNVHK
jgi:hypothetical protein